MSAALIARALHERLIFDTAQGQVLDADRRYLLMRTDVFMAAFSFMPEAVRTQALKAFSQAVFERGRDSVRAYSEPDDPGCRRLFEAVAQGAASLGWGVWSLELGEHYCRLRVRNSPFARAGKADLGPSCSPIAGMLKAVCTHAWQAQVDVQEVCCTGGFDTQQCEDECIFEARVASCHAHGVP